MGHDSVDKHIKGKLEQRSIQPSSEAWGKLSNMLDEENEQPNKKRYFRYAVAASVVFLLGFFFTSQYNNRETIIIDDAVVAVEEQDINANTIEVFSTPVVDYLKKNEITITHIEKKSADIVQGKSDYAYIQLLDRKEEARQEEEIAVIKEKVDQYLVQLEKSKQGQLNKEIEEYDLDAEINALLAEASSNLPEEKMNNNYPVFQLDKETDMLLVAAFQQLNFNPEEDVLNETLKNKLLKQLEKGYFESKILLAERRQLTRP